MNPSTPPSPRLPGAGRRAVACLCCSLVVAAAGGLGPPAGVSAAAPAAVAATTRPPAGCLDTSRPEPGSGAARSSTTPHPPPPPAGEHQILIDVDRKTLTFLVNGEPYHTFPVAVGREPGLTPIGEWRVVRKDRDWGGGFGSRWMELDVPWGTYGIHGTDKPWTIGTEASAGCIRMFNHDVEILFPWVQVGTPVTIVGRGHRVVFARTLAEGQTGRDVVLLQLALRDAGFDPGRADGRFGPATAGAVRRAEAFLGLPTDGRAGFDLLYLLGLVTPEDLRYWE